MNFPATFSSTGRKLDDWLSPILVKELRQGMRARVFVISFLLLQVFLVVLVLGNVAAQEDRNALDIQNHFFWVIVGFALLVLMPLRGLVAISLEVKNHTMETIMLTRLTAWRVVFGKWSALFAQSLLFVSAVLPYVVLRYFIGGDDIVSDFAWILFMLWLSGILIAASIAVSALANAVVRVIILIGVIVLAVNGSDEFVSSGTTFGGAWEVMGWLLIFGFFVPALLFELTASGIAPASENHAIRRRLLALLFFSAACSLAGAASSAVQVGVLIPLIILIGICYFELAEKPRLLPRMVQSLARKGLLGRIAAFFLLPGWPSALLFSLVVIPSAMGIWYQFEAPDGKAGWLLPIFAVLGSILTPILICHLFLPRLKQVLLMVVLYNIVLMALSSLLQGFASLTHSHVDQVLAFLPGLPVLLASLESETIGDFLSWYVMGNLAVLTFLVLVLLLRSRTYYRDLIALFRSADNFKTSPDSLEPEPVMP